MADNTGGTSPWSVDPNQLANLAKQSTQLSSPDLTVQGTQMSEQDYQDALTQEYQARFQQNYQQITAADRANESPITGLMRSTSQATQAVLSYPFQVLMNTSRVAAANAAGADTGTSGIDTVKSVISNADLANVIIYGVTGDESFDPGDSWFSIEGSNAANIKLARDMQEAGQLSGKGENAVSLTVGQRTLDKTFVPKDSAAYHALSGLVDAATYAADPSSWVGGAELKGALRAAQFGRRPLEGGTAAAARIGAQAAEHAAAAKTLDTLDTIATQSARAKAIQEQLAGRLSESTADFIKNQRPLAQQAYDDAGRVIVDHETSLTRQEASGIQGEIDGWHSVRQQLRDAQIQVGAERRRADQHVVEAQGRLADAQSAFDTVSAKPATKPLADGITIDSPMSVNVRPSPREVRASDPQAWRGNFEYTGAPTQDSVALHQVLAHDSEGNVVGHLFWNPETGLIEDIATDPNFRRQGIATALFDQATSVAKERGWKVPEHATQAGDLSETGAAFKAAEQGRQRPGELASAQANLEAAQSHARWAQDVHGNLIDETKRLKRDAVITGGLELAEKKLAELKDARALHEQVGLAQVKALAEKFGGATPETIASAREYIRNTVGLTGSLNGQDVASVDKALSYLSGRNSEKLLNIFAGVHDPTLIYDMTRGQFSADTLRALANATTPEEVRLVLSEALTTGEISNGLRGITALRIASQQSLGGPLERQVDKALFPLAKPLRWGYTSARSNVPWNIARNLEDKDGMLQLVADSATYFDKHWRKGVAGESPLADIRAKYMNAIIDSDNMATRRLAWEGFLHDSTRAMLKNAGVDSEDIQLVMSKLRNAQGHAKDATHYTAEIRAANQGRPIYLNGKRIGDAATLESEMNNLVTSPDWKEMQRLLNSRRRVQNFLDDSDTPLAKAEDLATAVSDALFENYWRTSVLAFRGGFILRNLGDIQWRMMLNGQPSMFTDPIGIMSMAVTHAQDPEKLSAVGRILRKVQRANLDVDGVPLIDGRLGPDELASLDWQTRKLWTRDTSFVDPGSPNQPWLMDGSVKYVHPTDPEFHRGWAKELGLLYASPMANRVYAVERGMKVPALDRWMKEQGLTDRRQGLVDYYWSGPGRKELDDFANEATQMGRFLKTRDDLQAYFYENSAASLKSRWDRLTDGYNGAVTGVLDGLRNKAPKDMGYLARNLKTAFPPSEVAKRVNAGTWNIDDVRVLGRPGKMFNGQAGRMVRAATDAFFDLSYKGEKNFGYAPAFVYSKHDIQSQLIGALSPEDAATVLANARKTLDAASLPGSWKMRTLAKYEAGAKRASGDGTFTIKDLQTVGDTYATKENKRLFYDAAERNQTAHALRLISPFAQAFVNTLRVWGRLAARKSNRLYNANNLYIAAQGEGTNIFTDNPNDPEDSLIYSDPQTGQMMLSVPVVGNLMGMAASIRSGQDVSGLVSGDMPVQSFNLAFQNTLSPGFGPAIAIPASMLESSSLYQRLPDGIKRSIIPYVQTDPDRAQNVLTQLTPSWASDILAGMGVAGYTDRIQKYIGPAMGALYSRNPARYQDSQGFLDAAGQARLLKDAQAVASGLGISRGILQNSSAGTILPKIAVADKNGNTLSPYLITQQFYDDYANTGSRDQAMANMLDKYGVNAIMTLLPSRESGYTPTDDAYKFLLDNPDEGSKYPNALSILFPGGGYSAYLARWNNVSGRNKSLDADQVVQWTNSLMRQAQDSENDRQLAAGEIDQSGWQARHDEISSNYQDVPQAPGVFNSRDVTIAELTNAVNDPAFKSAPGYDSIATYLGVRQVMLQRAGGKSFDGKTKAAIREWLRNTGLKMAADDPNFAVAWARVFSGEVAE